MKYSELLCKILKPVTKEFPFFCMYILLMGNIVVRRLHGKAVSPLQYQGVSYLDIITSTTAVFLFAYVFSWFLFRCRRKWVHVIAYFFLISLFAVDFFLIQNFRMFISPNVFVLLAETNANESKEFISTFMGVENNIFVYITVFAVIILSWALEKYYRPIILPATKRIFASCDWLPKVFSVFVAVALASGIYALGTYIRMLKCDSTDDLSKWENSDRTNPHDPLTNTVYAFRGVHIAKVEMERAIEATVNLDRRTVCQEDSLTVVFVIGESYIKPHAQIYGYELNTTPYLQQEKDSGNLFAFQDVCSPFNMTSYSMKNMLCCNSISEGEKWHQTPFFPAIFKFAGYKIYFEDNQKGDKDASWSFALNSFLYNDYIKSVFTESNTSSFEYDGELIDYFRSRLDTENDKDFVIFHLMGQHSDASCRYPHTQEFSVFTADSIKREASYLTQGKRERIAHYDNSVYYNDYVMKKIIEPLKCRNAVLVYLSDHGEEMYDYRDFEGRRGNDDINKQYLEYQFGIPFMIWCSRVYQNHHPETMRAIREALDRPFMIDNVCHVLFHLAGIKTTYYKPERDVLNDKYRRPKRIVNKTINYDQYEHI